SQCVTPCGRRPGRAPPHRHGAGCSGITAVLAKHADAEEDDESGPGDEHAPENVSLPGHGLSPRPLALEDDSLAEQGRWRFPWESLASGRFEKECGDRCVRPAMVA